MRNAFIDELVQLASINSHLALIVGDLGYSVIEPFADRFPDRFVNAGVAEQNMAGIAAGMASEGYHVFTYSIANFPTFRCAEQIRNDIDYQGLPVTTVAVGGGLGYGPLGYSHHAVQDYALMRVLPSTLLAVPGCPQEVRACMRYLVANPQPSYLRLGKAGEPILHPTVPEVVPGEWIRLRAASEGDTERLALLATGAISANVMNWAQDPELAHAAVYTLPLWGQRFKARQKEQAEVYDRLVTIEDHLVDGGFGSWVTESLQRGGQKPICCSMGLDPAVCGLVGSQETLNALGGLTLDAIKDIALNAGA